MRGTVAGRGMLDVIQIIKSKLKNKSWANACIMFGVMLFIAVSVCHPMFLYGAENELLRRGFWQYIEENNEHPAVLSRTQGIRLKSGEDVKQLFSKLRAYQETWQKYLELSVLASQSYATLNGDSAQGNYEALSNYYSLCYMPDIKEHSRIIKGDALAAASADEGVIPCLVSVRTMDEAGLVCGEILTFGRLKDGQGNPLKLQVVGIIEESEEQDGFWCDTLETLKRQVFLSEEDFLSLAGSSSFPEVNTTLHAVFDYHEIMAQDVKQVKGCLSAFQAADENFTETLSRQFADYEKQKDTLSLLLWVLTLPMFLLLFSFLIMVSDFSVKAELTEIAMMKSRGYSKADVVLIYIVQSSVLSLVAMLPGIPLGYGLCKLAASTDSFFSFHAGDTASYSMVWQMIPFGFGAVVVAVVLLTLPAYFHSNQSIVEQKSLDTRSMLSPLWQRLGMDVILVLLSLYLLYNYNRQKEQFSMSVLNQEGLDPIIFINTFLFLLGLSMLSIRLTGYLVRLMLRIRKNRLSPELFASFLQITRTYKQQGLLSVFLVVTIGMGLLNANLARTINQNGQERVSYEMGTDYILQQQWKLSVVMRRKDDVKWYYREPDYAQVKEALSGRVESMTRVVRDEEALLYTKGQTINNCTLMGISTKEFGETAMLKEGLTKQHWYYALNALAEKTNGVIISENLAEEYHYKVGDIITYSRVNPLDEEKPMAQVSAEIVSIVTAWPGYKAYSYEKNEEGTLSERKQYLLVSNYAFMANVFGMTPYEIWIKAGKGHAQDEKEVLLEYLKAGGVSVNGFEGVREKQRNWLNQPMLQITNGMYTLSFLVSLLLCLVGFFLYWLRSLKQRQPLFGVYRAMGMRLFELNRMLVHEQLYSSLPSIFSGMLSGGVSTCLFVTLIALVYLPEKHNVALHMVVEPWDIVKLLLFLVLMCGVCLLVMKRFVKRMKLNESMKLGED